MAGLVAFAGDARAGIDEQRFESRRAPFAFGSRVPDSVRCELGNSLFCDLVMAERNEGHTCGLNMRCSQRRRAADPHGSR